MQLKDKQEERLKNITYNILPPFPKELYLEVNSSCNHKCFFCANIKMSRSKEFIDDELAKKIMLDSFKEGSSDITFFATGEPLIFPKLAEYIKYAKEIGYSYIFLTSNGALATKEKIENLIDSGLNSIKFSINAGTKESYKKIHGKDDFDKVIENVKYFDEYRKKVKSNIKLFVSLVPTKINDGEYNSLMKKIGNYIDQEIDMRSCSNQGGNMEENNQYENINPENILGTLKTHQFQKICPDPFNRIIVSAEGYLTACVVDYQNALIIKNLKDISIGEAWRSEEFQNFRKKHLENNLQDLICYNCLNNVNNEFKPLDKQYFKPFKIEKKDMERYYE